MQTRSLPLFLLVLAGFACGDRPEDDLPDASTPTDFALAGRVSGLAGSGLVLANGDETLSVTADGPVAFAKRVAAGASYEVSVRSQPALPTQLCVVANGAGTASADVAFEVTCTTSRFPVSVAVAGVRGAGLSLALEPGGELLPVAADGTFAFVTRVESGRTWGVTVATQPTDPWQSCTVADGQGTVGGEAVSNVRITCETSRFRVGGVLSGLAGKVVVGAGDGNTIELEADGEFALPSAIESGAPYELKVVSHSEEPSQTCTVENGEGTIRDADVTDVAVKCATNSFRLGVVVEGLRGTGLALVAGDQRLDVAEDGEHAFELPLPSGTDYAITIAGQPSSPLQKCEVANGAGRIGAADVLDVRVTCTTERFALGGTLSGLLSGTLVLKTNGQQAQLEADGRFDFPTPIESGAAYRVEVETQPAGQTCSVVGGIGAVVAAPISNLAVTCVPDLFALGGKVTGLLGTVVLGQGELELALEADGDFAFPGRIPFNTPYDVVVKADPVGQRCTVTGGKATMGPADVANVAVTCESRTYALGGELKGLAGKVVLANGTDELALEQDGPFTFGARVAFKSAFEVKVKTPPEGQECVVVGGSGTMGAADLATVAVRCTTLDYTLGGKVAGLYGKVVLANGDAELTLEANGAFAFPVRLLFGTAYEVTVKNDPAGQQCTVASGAGKMGAGDVESVAVTCVDRTYALGGEVKALVGSVVLANGADEVKVEQDGLFTMQPVAFRAAYDVKVKTQPEGQECTVEGGAGTMGTGAVSSIVVSCRLLAYPLSVAVTGLSGSLVVANGTDTLTVSAPGELAFANAVTFREPYEVQVKTHPVGQECVLGDGASGAMPGRAVKIAVTCTNRLYLLGGTVRGLTGTVVLKTAAGDEVSVSEEGPFAFPQKVAYASSYEVSVKTDPEGLQCRVSAGAGTVGAADVDTVVVSCAKGAYALGGVLRGLSGVLTIRNGADELVLDEDGPFTFEQPVGAGDPYAVVVKSQPVGQDCTVTEGEGSMGSGPIGDVRVECVNLEYQLGGRVDGLLSGTVTVREAGGATAALSANGTFTFEPTFAFESAFSVEVSAQPSGQTCAIESGTGTGTMGPADSLGIRVKCAPNTYTVGGEVKGLAGTLKLALEGGDELSIGEDGTFVFATRVAFASTWTVSATSPATHTCTFDRTTGTMGAGNVTDLVVNCVRNRYAIGGLVTGLEGSLTLTNNGGEPLVVEAAGEFSFPEKVESGADYRVAIASAPDTQDCTISEATGTVGTSAVDTVRVACVTKTFTLGGEVTGLTGKLVLTNGGKDELTVEANGTFTFATKVAVGARYEVKVASEPENVDCGVSFGTGTMPLADYADVRVSCGPATYALGGEVSGLAGTVVLQNNEGDDLSVTGTGTVPFAFATRLSFDEDYVVTVKSSPAAQDCTVASGGTGTVGLADVTSVRVSCAMKKFAVGGKVSGLAGGTVVLQNNGADDLSVTGDGEVDFTFAVKIASGADYAVTVKGNPSGKKCTVTAAGTGKVETSDVTAVRVACVDAPPSFFVLRIGNGTSTSSTSAPLFLEEFAVADGSAVRSIAVPSTAGEVPPVTLNMSQPNDGALSRSADGRYLTFAGYNAPAGTASVSGTTGTVAQRTVVRMASDGSLSYTKLGTAPFSGQNVRSAVTSDGTGYWVTGSSGGVWYAPADGAAPLQVATNASNTRWAGIFGGQLFVSSAGSSMFGLAAVGTGTPVTTGHTTALLPGFSTSTGPNPNGYALFDANPNVAGLDLAYIADERTVTNTGGIQKWTFDGTKWTYVKTFGSGPSSTTGARGLAARVEGTGYRILATTNESAGNRVITVLDDGSASPAVTNVRTAAANTIYRGVAFAP